MGQQEFYLQKAGQNLAAAELLLQKGFDDIAASRAYYAMFYIAEALLFTKGLAFSSHSAVIAAYGKEFAQTRLLKPEHHKHLRDGFMARQIGDYGIEKEISNSTVAELIEWGNNFLKDAEKFLAKSG
ncbi:MAG: hypothetical protein A2136_02755 [Chloroflexi bacterium RBG_16_54_11]|nr:MAG: hypothetical protein A2136_02755 [Chloroflexi bacterium RBG_16_54_11]